VVCVRLFQLEKCLVYLRRMEPYDVIVNQPVVIDNVSRRFVVSDSLCRTISCFLNCEYCSVKLEDIRHVRYTGTPCYLN
jgi:hypothetical protein